MSAVIILGKNFFLQAVDCILQLRNTIRRCTKASIPEETDAVRSNTVERAVCRSVSRTAFSRMMQEE